MHITRAYLPSDVAKALPVNPSLVQKAVETFYTRDGLQLRVRFPGIRISLMLTLKVGSTEDVALSA